MAGYYALKSGFLGYHYLFVASLQDDTKDDSMICIRARNPRFYFVHAGAKPRFLTKKGHQKSGIPCSDMPLIIVANKKVAFSALGEKTRIIGIRSVVKVDNAKITTDASILVLIHK
jgi:hypothetical protein